MFSSNNKPTRRSARTEQRSGRARNSAENRSHSRARTSGDTAGSFDRSSYGTQASHSSRRAGASAYGASNYGSSTRQGASSARRVPATPAAANSQYSRNANDREAVLAQRARRKRILGVTLAIVAALLVGGIGAAWAYVSQLDSNLSDGLDSSLLDALSATDTASDPFYMLLIGIDRSEERDEAGDLGGVYRTDTMILARVDPQNKTVTLVSIPRDTQVDLGEYGTQKINAAYAFGGASLAVNTVEDLAGVEISHYAEIDFDGLTAIVDTLGGIDVDVPVEIDDDDAGGYLAAGQQTLNGEQALILCRSRHTYANGDVVRAACQRLVIQAITEKALSSDVATLTSTVSTLAEYVTTDLSVSEIVGLAQNMMGIGVSSNVYTSAVPTTSEYIDSIWWEVVNEEEWEAMMERIDQGLSPTEEAEVDEATGITLSSGGSSSSSSSSSDSSSSGTSLSGVNISVKNGAGITGCAAEAGELLTAEGATVETGNADDYNYSTTLIIYEDSSDADTAQAIADALGLGTVKQNDGTYSYSADILVVIGADWS